MKFFVKKERKEKDPLLQTYFVSLLSLVLCVGMFMGTTFAWFSSDVTSADNQIYVGALEVKLEHRADDGVWTQVAGDHKILDPNIFWEPGYTAIEWLKLTNTGDLSFNYRLKMASTDPNNVLGEIGRHFVVYACEGTYNKPESFEALKADTENWKYIGTLAEVMAGKSILSGVMDESVTSVTQFGFAIHMNQDADAAVMKKTLAGISVKLEAWQMGQETDAFGGDYDRMVATAQELTTALLEGGKVILSEDIDVGTEKIYVKAGKTVSLDLNGKTLSGVYGTGETSLLHVENGAVLNIRDTSAAADGKIVYHSTSGAAQGDAIQVDGELNLYAGTISLTGAWSLGFGVDVRPNAWGNGYDKPSVFRMYGGKIISSDSAVRVASTSAPSYPNVSSAFVMDGGELDAAWDGVLIQQTNDAYDVLSVTINAGKIAGDVSTIRILAAKEAASVVNGSAKPMTVTVNGGTFDYTGTNTHTWHTSDVLRVTVMESAKPEAEAVAAVLGYAEISIATGSITVETPSGQ